VSSSVGDFNPQKSGTRLPIIVNILAVVVIAAVVLVSVYMFEIRHEDMMQDANSYLSSEGKILEVFKRESKEKLRQKDEEIQRIQKQLEELDRERLELIQDIEARYKKRENELKLALNHDLDTERDRLEALGDSPEEINAKIGIFEKELRLNYDRELKEYEREVEALKKDKEKNLILEREHTKKILDDAKRERERLYAEIREREKELAEKYEREKTALQQRTTLAEQRLQSLTLRQEKEQLFTAQIIASYAAVMDMLEKAEFETAAASLTAMRDMLLDESFDSIPSIAERRDIELFIIDSLLKITKEADDKAAQVESAKLLFTIRDTIIEADALSDKGRIEEARELYYTAMDDILSVGIDTYETSISQTIGTMINAGTPDEVNSAIEQYRVQTASGDSADNEVVFAAFEIVQKSLTRLEGYRGRDELVLKLESENRNLRERLSQIELELQNEQRDTGDTDAVALLEGKILTLQRRLSEREQELEVLTDRLKREREESDKLLFTVSSTVHDADALFRRGEDDAAPVEELEAEHFLGILSSISGNNAVIETLVEVPVEYGETVLVSRNNGSKNRIDIAKARVLEIAPGMVGIMIYEILDATHLPRESDLVYTVKQSG
jgi:hypothetical protein